ncbi:hypothetical protein HanIR_Chr04g0165751 [Helianthus annuus]|nr:hypothetical protein HanIR_Chr04g0165751 [Helianthus annuus]
MTLITTLKAPLLISMVLLRLLPLLLLWLLLRLLWKPDSAIFSHMTHLVAPMTYSGAWPAMVEHTLITLW